MGFSQWTLLVLVFPLLSLSYHTPSPLDSNCLYRRSRCLHDTACRLRIVEFDSICGESSTECLSSSPSSCVKLVWEMRHWLGEDRCDCHPLFGSYRECNIFGHLLYEHPCEILLKKEPEKDDYRSIGVTRDYGRRRTTRSPSNIQINEWKKQLSGHLFSLATSTQLQSQECDVALHQICLRHVSCSQLWNLFRTNCNVDSDNTCIMPQREACWESFEGLLWTGLGRCHCSSNVSDCHWIRLHTNFNKCIYDISRSSGMSLSSFIPLTKSSPSPPSTTQRVSFLNFASQSLSTPSPITTTVPPTVSHSYSHIQSTTDSSPIPTITVLRPHEIPRTPQSQRVHSVSRSGNSSSVHSTHQNTVQGQYHPSSQSIDNRQTHPGYSNPTPSTLDPRIDQQSYPGYSNSGHRTQDRRMDNRSQIRVNHVNGEEYEGYSASSQSGRGRGGSDPSRGYSGQSRNQRVDNPLHSSSIPPNESTNRVDYSTPSKKESRQDYRTQEEINRSQQPSQYSRQDQSRLEGPDHRNPTPDPYRITGANSQHHYTPVPTYPTQEYGRSNVFQNEQTLSQQDTVRSRQSNYGIPSTPFRPDYGRSDSSYRTSDGIEVGSDQRSSSRHGNGMERERSSSSWKESNRLEGREDNRMGQITKKTNGDERRQMGSNRQSVDRATNEDRFDSSTEVPQHISLVNNEERSRDEYQVSSPGITPSYNNPTIITSVSANSRVEEEKRRRKEEEERRVKEEKREREREKEREREREKEREKVREREEMRQREERRKMEDKRRKEEEDGRKREEKIRQDEEEKKIEEERRMKEKERDEKTKEKERQEKVAASRKGSLDSESVSLSSTSCLSALRECESVEECKFQLAELKTRCGRNCEKKQCQGALRRFSSFVPPSLSMALSFCSCPNGDEKCPEKELLYPSCLYERNDQPRCEKVNEECRRDHKCKTLMSSMADECPIVKGACDGGTRCTQLLLKARGSTIDTQCTCLNKDKDCLSIHSMMIPNHPCLAESRREFYRLETQESSISLKTTKSDNSMDGTKKTSVVGASRARLTTTTEPQLKGEEVESAPWLTTITVPTTTTVYTTHAPPPAEGCSLKDSKGRSLFYHVGTVLRRNLDWSGRCSSWCECVDEEVLSCHGLPCSQDINCTSHSPHFTHQYGERLYLKDRGPCMCETGEYTCAMPPEDSVPQLYPGIYLFLGYSQSDIDLLEKEMPSDVYQRAGFLSNRRATDIASQLQIVLESLLPHGLHCRLSVVNEFVSPGNALIRVEWHGLVKRLNQSKVSWQWGMAEKACAKYIRALEDIFDLNDSPRFQLVLSTVKQMKVHDMLDSIPDSAPFYQSISIQLITVLITLRYLF